MITQRFSGGIHSGIRCQVSCNKLLFELKNLSKYLGLLIVLAGVAGVHPKIYLSYTYNFRACSLVAEHPVCIREMRVRFSPGPPD